MSDDVGCEDKIEPTSTAKILNWSIISLIVFTKLSISPDTLTPTIFCVKSPRATAVVATAMVRTYKRGRKSSKRKKKGETREGEQER